MNIYPIRFHYKIYFCFVLIVCLLIRKKFEDNGLIIWSFFYYYMKLSIFLYQYTLRNILQKSTVSGREVCDWYSSKYQLSIGFGYIDTWVDRARLAWTRCHICVRSIQKRYVGQKNTRQNCLNRSTSTRKYFGITSDKEKKGERGRKQNCSDATADVQFITFPQKKF